MPVTVPGAHPSTGLRRKAAPGGAPRPPHRIMSAVRRGAEGVPHDRDIRPTAKGSLATCPAAYRTTWAAQLAGNAGLGGIGGDLIRKALPILAPIVMSYLANKIFGQGGPGGVAGGSGAGQAGRPAGSVLDSILGGILGAGVGAGAGRGSGAGQQGSVLDSILGSLGGIFGGGTPAETPAETPAATADGTPAGAPSDEAVWGMRSLTFRASLRIGQCSPARSSRWTCPRASRHSRHPGTMAAWAASSVASSERSKLTGPGLCGRRPGRWAYCRCGGPTAGAADGGKAIPAPGQAAAAE